MEISYRYFVIFIIFFIDGLENFIVNFILIAWGISLSISYLFPGAFNGFFILVPWVFHCQSHIIPWHFQWIFHCQFHLHSLALSMDFSLLYLGHFIVNFISIPWRFHWIFHSCTLGISLSILYIFPATFNGFFIVVPWGFHFQFHIYSLALSIDGWHFQ